ncbi:RCC1/BLIP-II [Myriangium duriaei CBS 260.36]|uniref:RCC1/BLIP-II n=1 Tax=Myriangium duriaei CBS 260.36 TaxID=1168546 RepID=A0A9P4J581_9PEZI|nr:RCC1/BLIP-II [Myriangium duriaei CBS 260.36]
MGHRWLFAGLNSHGIVPSTAKDVRRYTQISESSHDEGTAFVCWSQVVMVFEGRLVAKGISASTIEVAEGHTFGTPFGDHNGIIGSLDTDGRLLLVEDREISPLKLSLVSQEDSPRVAAVAISGNGRIALALNQMPQAGRIHIHEFSDLHHLGAWYTNPSDPQHQPAEQHSISGQLKQLTANSTIFICLTDTGEVYTWGDGRYQALGRSINQPADTPAIQPGLVETLGGIKVTKISANGWSIAALSEDKAVYLFSSSTPGNEHAFRMTKDAQAEEMGLVDIPDAAGEPRDFDDVAVGDGHVLVLCTSGAVFAAGDNRNGQLGLEGYVEHVGEWTEVMPYGCSAIVAGPKSSLIRMAAS